MNYLEFDEAVQDEPEAYSGRTPKSELKTKLIGCLIVLILIVLLTFKIIC